MKFINIALPIYFGLFVCLVSLVQAGGDKSAKTTVITLAGGDKGGQGYPIPIPIPICSNGRAFGGGFGRRR